VHGGVLAVIGWAVSRAVAVIVTVVKTGGLRAARIYAGQAELVMISV